MTGDPEEPCIHEVTIDQLMSSSQEQTWWESYSEPSFAASRFAVTWWTALAFTAGACGHWLLQQVAP